MIECLVCLECVTDICITKCNHSICNICIEKILKCPLCRCNLRQVSYDFNFINIESRRLEISSAYNTITEMNKWDFLKNYNPDEECGFMFDQNEEINNIKTKINENYNGHSGCSLAITMRHMHEIAKYGIEYYKNTFYPQV